MAKKVLLVNPRFPEEITLFNFPVSLLCLGSWLKREGYTVSIVDSLHYKDTRRVLDRVADELKGAMCVGLSVMTAQIPSALEICKHIRAVAPSVPIVWGGVHPTLYPEQVVRCKLADFVVRDEGEATFSELLDVLDGDKSGFVERLEKVNGISFRVSDSMPTVTPNRERLRLDELPAIDLDLIQSLAPNRNLREISELAQYGLPVLTSKGCNHRCAFCINSVLAEQFRHKGTDLVLDEIKALSDEGVERVWFVDETFFAKKSRVVELLDGIEARGLRFKWFASVRPDYFRASYLGDNDLLERIKSCGCQIMGAGAESGSQRVLDRICKDITVWDTLNMAARLSVEGIPAPFSFMIGLPGETGEDYRKTLGLMRGILELDSRHWILGPQIYRPYPGSVLYNECVETGLKEPKTVEAWADSPYIHAEFSKKSYFTKEYYPWVNYDGDLTNLAFYASLMGMKPERRWITKVLRLIGGIRCRLYFFRFPVVKWLYGVLRGSWVERLLRSTN